jgi:hypothetical protein
MFKKIQIIMGIIDKLNKDFESRIRLGLMSVLMVNDWIDFTDESIIILLMET